MKGTHLGEWAGLKPIGRKMDVPVACIFDFDKDQLICENVYFDMATLVNQLVGLSNFDLANKQLILHLLS